MTIRRYAAFVLLAAGLSGVTACGGGEPAADKPAAPAVTFKPVPSSGSGSPPAAPPLVGGPGQPSAMVTDMATGWPITLQVGQDVQVRLSTDRAAGMTWKQRGSTDVLAAPATPVFEAGQGAAPGTEIYTLKAAKTGQATITFVLQKAADPNAAPARTVTYQVTVR